MAKSGDNAQDITASLAKLQSQNVPANEYAAALDALVAGGKMTPAATRRLAEQYRRQRAEDRAFSATLSTFAEVRKKQEHELL